ACQKYRAGFVNDEGLIRHDRQIGASCYTASHNGSDLHYAHGRHLCVVAKLSSEMLLIRKNLILKGSKHTCTIYKINNGQMVFHRYLLRPEILLSRYRKPSSGFYGGIVGHYYAEPLSYISYPYNYAARRAAPFSH